MTKSELENEARLVQIVEQHFGRKLNAHLLRAVKEALELVNTETLLRTTSARSLRERRGQRMPSKKELAEVREHFNRPKEKEKA